MEDVTGATLLDPVTGRPRLLTQQCSTCVGRPGDLMHLGPGRLKLLVKDNTGPHNLGLICHQTLSYGDHPDFGHAYCRWFYDTYGDLANGIRVFKRLMGFTEVDPPGQDDEHPGGGLNEQLGLHRSGVHRGGPGQV